MVILKVQRTLVLHEVSKNVDHETSMIVGTKDTQKKILVKVHRTLALQVHRMLLERWYWKFTQDVATESSQWKFTEHCYWRFTERWYWRFTERLYWRFISEHCTCEKETKFQRSFTWSFNVSSTWAFNWSFWCWESYPVKFLTLILIVSSKVSDLEKVSSKVSTSSGEVRYMLVGESSQAEDVDGFWW